MVEGSKPGHAFVACLLIGFFSSTLSLFTRYLIIATVDPEWATWVAVLVAICINIISFGAAGMARKKYTGKAFGSVKDAGRKLAVAVGTAVLFSIGAYLVLGQFLSGGHPLTYICACDGRSVIDQDVLFRYAVSWVILYALVAGIAFVFMH